MEKQSESFVCWKCGAAMTDHPLPLARTAACRSCTAELCVCKMCNFYDTSVAKSCRETIADEVSNKESANFCDYFSLRPNAYQPKDLAPADKAQTELEQLFGLNSSDSKQDDQSAISAEESTRNALDDLFKK